MKQSQQTRTWQRWVTLWGLLGLLSFCAVSASHVHANTATGSVKQECQVCLSGGLHPTLLANPQVSTAVVLTFFLLVIPQEQLRSVPSLHSGAPRSPPLS